MKKRLQKRINPGEQQNAKKNEHRKAQKKKKFSKKSKPVRAHADLH